MKEINEEETLIKIIWNKIVSLKTSRSNNNSKNAYIETENIIKYILSNTSKRKVRN